MESLPTDNDIIQEEYNGLDNHVKDDDERKDKVVVKGLC
jgi:hypothetical protein